MTKAVVLASCADLGLYLSSDDYYDAAAAQWYDARLTAWPEFRDEPADLGSANVSSQTINLVLADADTSLMTYDADWIGSTWYVQYRLEDQEQTVTDWIQDTTGADLTPPSSTDRIENARPETIMIRWIQCGGWQRTPGLITLSGFNLGWPLAEKLYPPDHYHGGSNLPTILQANMGWPIPVVIGRGVKVPGVLISEREDGDELSFDRTLADANDWEEETETIDDITYGWQVASGRAVHTANPDGLDTEYHYLAPTPAVSVDVDRVYRIRVYYETDDGSAGGLYVGIGRAWSDFYRGRTGYIDVTLTTLSTGNLLFRCSKNWSGRLKGYPAISVCQQTPWRYLICERQPYTVYWIDAVYLSNAIARIKDYRTRGTTPNDPWTESSDIPSYTFGDTEKSYIAVDFYEKPADSSGRFYDVAVDITADNNGKNVILEIRRLLEWAGLTCDDTSFNSAEKYADEQVMAMDWAYGARGDAVTLNSLLSQLLPFARAQLQAMPDGKIGITVDRPRSLDWSWSEPLGDLIEGLELSRTQPPKTLRVRYQPDVSNPSQLKYELNKTFSDGYGEVVHDIELVRAFEAADRYLSWLAGRYQHDARLRLMMLGQYPLLGDIAEIDIPWLQNSTLANYPWVINGRAWQDPNQCELSAYWDHPDRFVYTPSVRPAGSGDYDIDYTYTQPGAPLLILANVGDSYDSVNGTYNGVVTLVAQSDKPEFTQQVHFKLERTADFTITMQSPPPLASDKRQWQAVFTVIPGEQYYCWAWIETPSGLIGQAACLGFIAYAQTTVEITPTGLTGEVLTNQNYLSWDLPPVSILTVQIHRHLGDGEWETISNTSGSNTDWSDFAVTDDQNYYYRLVFFTRAGAASNYAYTEALTRP